MNLKDFKAGTLKQEFEFDGFLIIRRIVKVVVLIHI